MKELGIFRVLSDGLVMQTAPASASHEYSDGDRLLRFASSCQPHALELGSLGRNLPRWIIPGA
jgi:hypothetical protein